MTDTETILAELDKLAPSGMAALEPKFRRLYPVIKAKLDNGVKRKQIIALLAQHGMKLHHTQFDALIKAMEAGHRSEARVGMMQ